MEKNSKYQPLARKYRTQTFSDTLGQDFVIQVLQNSIKLNRLHQAYLFSGTRGTGKTSLARIFARAIRCENLQNSEPCNICGSCISQLRDNSVDILEIDGASNNGVDSIREIRENAQFLPSTGSKKIYIIDEVHMLSGSAFNALLKILEEPPAHVVFLFATTEIQKVPETILSRCLQLDLKKISISTIQSRIHFIADKEGIKITESASRLIAENAFGSMRDALSGLDQVAAFAGMNIQEEQVEQILGIVPKLLIDKLLVSIANQDKQSFDDLVVIINDKCFDPRNFLNQLLLILREKILDPNSKTAYEQIQFFFDLTVDHYDVITKSERASLLLEMFLRKLFLLPPLPKLESFFGTISSQGSNSNVPSQVGSRQDYKKFAPPENYFQGPSASAPPTPVKKSEKAMETLKTMEAFINYIKPEKPLVASLLEQVSVDFSLEKSILRLNVKAEQFLYEQRLKSLDVLNFLNSKLKDYFKKEIKIQVGKTGEETTLSSVTIKDEKNAQNLERKKELEVKLLSQPNIQKFVKELKPEVLNVEENKE